MSIGIELCTVLLEVLLSAYLYEQLFSRRRSFYIALAYYALFGVLVALGSFLIPVPAVRMLALLVYSLLGNYVVYQPTPLSGLYITLLYYLSVVLSDVVAGAILATRAIAADVAVGGSERLIYNAAAKLINLVLIQLILAIFQRDKLIRLPLLILPLLFCQVFSAIVCFRCYFALFDATDPTLFLWVALCLLTVNLVLCCFVSFLRNYYETQHAALAAQQQKELQLQHYQTLLERQEETRALWHDIKKYFSAMKTLVEADRTADADACFQEIQAKFQQINRTVDVGNPIVDSILSRQVALAQQAETPLELEVWVSPDLRVDPADLFIIIGNTADNALEACRALPREQRRIHLILRQTNGLLYYEISNPYSPQTGPKPGKIHGYGLKNVRQCVEKHQGCMQIEQDHGVYKVRIQLNA